MKNYEVAIFNQHDVKQYMSKEEAIEMACLVSLQLESQLHIYKSSMNIIALALATMSIIVSIRSHDIRALSLYGKLIITTPTIFLILSWLNLLNVNRLLKDIKQEECLIKRDILLLNKKNISINYLSKWNKSIEERLIDMTNIVRFSFLLCFLSLFIIVVSFYYYIYR